MPSGSRSSGSRRRTFGALAAAALLCFAASACGSSSAPSGEASQTSSPATVCQSLTDFDKAVRDATDRVKNAPKQAAAAVNSLDEQFHAFQQDLRQKAPGVASLLDQAMAQLDRAAAGATSNQDVQQAASTIEQHLSSVSQAVGKVESRIGC